MKGSYYKNQLARIVTDNEEPAQLKMVSDTSATNWLALNRESAQDLADWLYKHFGVVPDFKDGDK